MMHAVTPSRERQKIQTPAEAKKKKGMFSIFLYFLQSKYQTDCTSCTWHGFLCVKSGPTGARNVGDV